MQFDGYPSGHGDDLKKFFNKPKLVNGYSSNDEQVKRNFNGMSDLAIRLVTFLKNAEAKHKRDCVRACNNHTDTSSVRIRHPAKGEDCIGNFYLYPAGTRDADEEWIYTIYPSNGQIFLHVEYTYKHIVCYDGPVNKFQIGKTAKEKRKGYFE